MTVWWCYDVIKIDALWKPDVFSLVLIRLRHSTTIHHRMSTKCSKNTVQGLLHRLQLTDFKYLISNSSKNAPEFWGPKKLLPRLCTSSCCPMSCSCIMRHWMSLCSPVSVSCSRHWITGVTRIPSSAPRTFIVFKIRYLKTQFSFEVDFYFVKSANIRDEAEKLGRFQIWLFFKSFLQQSESFWPKRAFWLVFVLRVFAFDDKSGQNSGVTRRFLLKNQFVKS